MDELILSIRQMMADKKFTEALNLLESKISAGIVETKGSILPLYFSLLEIHDRKLPPKLLVTLVEELLLNDLNEAEAWFEKINPFTISRTEWTILKIKLNERKGNLAEVYKLISEFQIYLFENKIPVYPQVLKEFTQKYFKYDFHLMLGQLALTLQLGDLKLSETLVTDIILSCFEKVALKGLNEKFSSLISVIDSAEELQQLEIYKSLCRLYIDGLSDKKDFKKAAELVIYFERFEFHVFLLNLFYQNDLPKIVDSQVKVVRDHENFNFVYLDKHFPHLKKFFFATQAKKLKEKPSEPIDLELKAMQPELELPESETPTFDPEEEQKLIQLFKYQELDTPSLCEIAISFLQSKFPKVALRASEMALKASKNSEESLKASYLKLMSLMELKDYRFAIDVTMEALSIAKSEEDVLSFIYCQAEAYCQLGQLKQAHALYRRISSIDPSYRLTKERLEKLDAI